MFKKCEPKFVENSKIPVWLSKIAPIQIGAISFAFWVWGRGVMNKTTRRHETIHYQQQIELLFVGQWALYAAFWLIGLIKYRNGKKAYTQNLFEQEAYDNQRKTTYLQKRRRYAWIKYRF